MVVVASGPVRHPPPAVVASTRLAPDQEGLYNQGLGPSQRSRHHCSESRLDHTPSSKLTSWSALRPTVIICTRNIGTRPAVALREEPSTKATVAKASADRAFSGHSNIIGAPSRTKESSGEQGTAKSLTTAVSLRGQAQEPWEQLKCSKGDQVLTGLF